MVPERDAAIPPKASFLHHAFLQRVPQGSGEKGFQPDGKSACDSITTAMREDLEPPLKAATSGRTTV